MSEYEIINYLDQLSLVQALWYFIENVDDEHPYRQALFFHLRERVREEKTNG